MTGRVRPDEKVSGRGVGATARHTPICRHYRERSDGNVFDLSQRDMANRTAIYTENEGERRPRYISHVAVRTMHPERMADFYRDVLQLADVNKKPDDENTYLTDGKVTLVLVPWKITNYLGQSILPQAWITSYSRLRIFRLSRMTSKT